MNLFFFFRLFRSVFRNPGLLATMSCMFSMLSCVYAPDSALYLASQMPSKGHQRKVCLRRVGLKHCSLTTKVGKKDLFRSFKLCPKRTVLSYFNGLPCLILHTPISSAHTNWVFHFTFPFSFIRLSHRFSPICHQQKQEKGKAEQEGPRRLCVCASI